MWRRAYPAVLISTVACAPEPVEPAALGEVCGQPAPVRILELDPDDPLVSVGERTRIGNRRVLQIGYLDVNAPDIGLPLPARRETWMVGECGESPQLLADDVDLVTFPELWPDMLFGCRETTGEVVTLDPDGVRPENVVFELPACQSFYSTPSGLIVLEPHDEDFGALMLLPYPDDPWTETAVPEVLLDPIRIRVAPGADSRTSGVLRIWDDELFAVTPDDDLVHLSLVDGTLTTEVTGVREFQASEDKRWLAWQDFEVTNDDPEAPAGAVFLRDRMTGTDTYLTEVALGMTYRGVFSALDDGVIRLRLGPLFQAPERFWFLPEMNSVDVPADYNVIGRIDDGRWLVGDVFDGPYWLFDPELAQAHSLFADAGRALVREDGLEVIEDFECCIDQSWGRTEGKLWFAPWDGERDLLARRVTAPYATLADHRVLTTLDVDEHWLGSFRVVDPQTLEEQLMDERVLTGGKGIDVDEIIMYAVTDGDRSGVWLTKLAP